MKIVHVVDPFTGGLATFLKLLSEELSDDYHIIVHGERADLASYKEVRTIFARKNIRFVHWTSVQREIRPIQDIKAFIELKRILKRFRKADVIHLHSSKAGFLGRLACFQLRIKKVIYTPNGAPFLMPNVSKWKLWLYARLEKMGNFFGGKVICTSSSEKEEYEKIGIESDYINNGIRMTATAFNRNKDYHKFRIVTCGRIADQKNPEVFNEIASKLSPHKHFEFIWIGDGEEVTSLSSPNVTVTGWLSRKGVHDEIIKCDLYFSSSFFEGLPFAVMEAMSAGKCLLLSNCTGNMDLVKTGVNGELFDNADDAVAKIMYFYVNKEITESMGLNSLEICREYFNIEETALRYSLEYQKLNGVAVDQEKIERLKNKREISSIKAGAL